MYMYICICVCVCVCESWLLKKNTRFTAPDANDSPCKIEDPKSHSSGNSCRTTKHSRSVLVEIQERLFRSFCDGLRSICKVFLFLFERIPKCFFIGESTRQEVGAHALSLSSNLCMHLRMHRSRCLCIYVCIRIYTLTYGTDHLRNSRNQACLARVTVEW